MKLRVKIICLALIAISVASCKKDNNSTSTPVKMGATISGKAWDSNIRVTYLQNNYFLITGTSLSLDALALTIKGSTTGTYTLSVLPASAQCAATYTIPVTGGNPDIYASVDGKVVLTKVDKTAKLISGTFEFTLTNGSATKSVTNGQFNDLQYVEY
jgi:hypothetical protein